MIFLPAWSHRAIGRAGWYWLAVRRLRAWRLTLYFLAPRPGAGRAPDEGRARRREREPRQKLIHDCRVRQHGRGALSGVGARPRLRLVVRYPLDRRRRSAPH